MVHTHSSTTSDDWEQSRATISRRSRGWEQNSPRFFFLIFSISAASLPARFLKTFFFSHKKSFVEPSRRGTLWRPFYFSTFFVFFSFLIFFKKCVFLIFVLPKKNRKIYNEKKRKQKKQTGRMKKRIESSQPSRTSTGNEHYCPTGVRYNHLWPQTAPPSQLLKREQIKT